MSKMLKFGLHGLAVSALLIGCCMAVFGSHAVVTFFNNTLSLLYNGGYIVDLSSPNVDSELRFYGVMFAFYGGVLMQTARDIDHYFTRIPALLLVFSLAGLARLIGWIYVGEPHVLFTTLMIIEFILPAVLILCWYQVKRTRA